jgi:hypothetical protein
MLKISYRFLHAVLKGLQRSDDAYIPAMDKCLRTNKNSSAE